MKSIRRTILAKSSETGLAPRSRSVSDREMDGSVQGQHSDPPVFFTWQVMRSVVATLSGQGGENEVVKGVPKDVVLVVSQQLHAILP